jgi:hypothetical protein
MESSKTTNKQLRNKNQKSEIRNMSLKLKVLT